MSRAPGEIAKAISKEQNLGDTFLSIALSGLIKDGVNVLLKGQDIINNVLFQAMKAGKDKTEIEKALKEAGYDLLSDLIINSSK